ncbi:hypothetical protein [Methanoculleus sp.]|uniref:hypothetical protein n=1 Tax=Methanoculleus sp. TaxID=90427 RepID=UPI0025FBB5DE|nr:hypothetical protein [Methanoculleus sp.]
MDKNQRIVLVAGGLIALGLLFIDVFFALIALIIILVLLMSFRIMGDTKNYPLVTADLSEDAREVIITNTGTARAQKIQVALVPLNIDFEIASLDPDEESGFSLASMVSEAKAVVTYENSEGQQFQRSYSLTALGAGRDPTEPLFPIFGSR